MLKIQFISKKYSSDPTKKRETKEQETEEADPNDKMAKQSPNASTMTLNVSGLYTQSIKIELNAEIIRVNKNPVHYVLSVRCSSQM